MEGEVFMHGYYMLALCELHNKFLPRKLGGGEGGYWRVASLNKQPMVAGLLVIK